MSRKFAQIQTKIWSDDAFKQLTTNAQLLYLTCVSHSSLSYAAVLDYRPGRLAALAHNWTPQQIEQAAEELETHGYLIIDRDTEEAFVRSFHRNDDLMKQTNMGTSVARATQTTYSRRILHALAHELHRLRDEYPHMAGFRSDELQDFLNDYPPGSNDPTTKTPNQANPEPTNNPKNDPSIHPSNEGQRKGSTTANNGANNHPSAGGSNGGSPTTYNLQPTPFTRGYLYPVTTRDDDEKTEPAPRPPGNSLTGDGPGAAGAATGPRCVVHRGVPDGLVPPCRGCGAAREAAEAAREGAKERLGEVRRACTSCDESGWLLGPSGGIVQPAVKCDHGLGGSATGGLRAG